MPKLTHLGLVEVHQVRVRNHRERRLWPQIIGLAQQFGVQVIVHQTRFWPRQSRYIVVLIGSDHNLTRFHNVKTTHRFIPPPPEV